MKKGLWAFSIVGLTVLAFGIHAWAVSPGELPPSQYTFETTVVTSNTASVGTFGDGSVLYGFRLIADDAGDSCGLYDVATIAGATTTQGVLVDELYQDTDNRSIDSDWPSPYVLTTDLTVLTNGICVIYHGVK